MYSFNDGIKACLSLKDPTVLKGMDDIRNKFYQENNIQSGVKLSDSQRHQLCEILAEYLLQGVKK